MLVKNLSSSWPRRPSLSLATHSSAVKLELDLFFVRI
jgi:hypothetical protein